MPDDEAHSPGDHAVNIDATDVVVLNSGGQNLWFTRGDNGVVRRMRRSEIEQVAESAQQRRDGTPIVQRMANAPEADSPPNSPAPSQLRPLRQVDSHVVAWRARRAEPRDEPRDEPRAEPPYTPPHRRPVREEPVWAPVRPTRPRWGEEHRERSYTPGDRQRIYEQAQRAAATQNSSRERDISFVAGNAGVSEEEAEQSLERFQWNVVNAIMDSRASPPREYSVLAVQVGNSPVPSRQSRQAMVDSRRRRFKAPTREFMQIADELQDKVPEGLYIKMANAAKGMYEAIEELDPTTVEGYVVGNDHSDFQTQEQLIASLEEQNYILQQENTQHWTDNAQLRNDIKEQKAKLASYTKMAKYLSELQTKVGTLQLALCGWRDHSVVGPRMAHAEAMDAIETGVDSAGKMIRPHFMAMRETAKFYTIESVKYCKTEWTEGFGPLGFPLDDKRSLWATWSPDSE